MRGLAGGTHDFTAFTPTQTEHVRFERDVMRAEWSTARRVLEFWIEADTFMRHMVRVLVGTMLEVAAGQRSHDDFKPSSREPRARQRGRRLRLKGLYLASVRY